MDAFLSSLELCRGGEEVQRVSRREEMLEKNIIFWEYVSSRHIKRTTLSQRMYLLLKVFKTRYRDTKIKKFTTQNTIQRLTHGSVQYDSMRQLNCLIGPLNTTTVDHSLDLFFL